MKKYLRVIIVITAISILSGCAAKTIPLMKLQKKYNPEVTKFESLGTITIEEFEDKRPSEEKVKDQKFKGGWQVWSGATDPELINYFSSIINRECEKSGLFSISDSADYKLKGNINSLKVIRRPGVMGTVAGYVILGGSILLYVDPVTALLVDLVALGMVIGNTNPQAVYVDFDAELYKDGIPIWQGQIKKKMKGRDWFASIESVSNKGALMLDKLITISVKQMLSEINEGSILGLKE